MRIYLAVLLILAPSTVWGAEIRQQPYQYSYNAAGDANSDREFVICDECPEVNGVVLRDRSSVVTITIKEDRSSSGKSGKGEGGKALIEDLGIERAFGDTVNRKAGREDNARKAQADQKLLATVYFELDRYDLRPEEAETIEGALSSLRKSGSLTVTGYTCDLGTREYNKRLARKRAETVADFLRGYGVETLKVRGKGKCCYVSTDRTMNRRVEISESKSGD